MSRANNLLVVVYNVLLKQMRLIECNDFGTQLCGTKPCSVFGLFLFWFPSRSDCIFYFLSLSFSLATCNGCKSKQNTFLIYPKSAHKLSAKPMSK